MIELIPWTQREFLFDQPLGAFPALLERLRGTPARAGHLIADVPEELLSTRLDGKWSVKEHLGHLVDLEALDEKRLREFQARVPVLSPADTCNQATENGNHRATPVANILERMHAGRAVLLKALEQLTSEQVAMVSIHPRLQKPLRLLDWAYFVAEHDDHHLACVTRALRELSGRFRQSHSEEWRRPIAG